MPPGPQRHGFDYWAAFNDGHHYFDGVYYRDDPILIAIDGYEPDGQTDLAIDFIEQSADPWALFVFWGPPHQPYEESIGVPLLVRLAGVMAEGKVHDGLVTTADLLPTLLTLLGCATPAGVEGADLAEGWHAATAGRGPSSAYILGPVPDHPRRTTVPWQEWRGVRTERYTCVESLDGPWLLFDNDADPFQQHNLVAEPSAASVLNECRGELRNWLTRTNDGFLPWRDLLRGKSLQELWNRRERLVHEGQEELL